METEYIFRRHDDICSVEGLKKNEATDTGDKALRCLCLWFIIFWMAVYYTWIRVRVPQCRVRVPKCRVRVPKCRVRVPKLKEKRIFLYICQGSKLSENKYLTSGLLSHRWGKSIATAFVFNLRVGGGGGSAISLGSHPSILLNNVDPWFQ